MSAPTSENVDDVVVVEDEGVDAVESENEDNARSLPHILTKYFEIVGTISAAGKADGKCLLCPNKTLSGTLNATTNLSKHLERIHPEAFKQYKTEIATNKGKRKRVGDSNLKPKKNPLGFKPIGPKKSLKQKAFDKNLVDYIVKSLKPFSTVSDPSFVNLFSFDHEIKVMSRSTLMRRIDDKKEKEQVDVVQELAKEDKVCTLADAWSSRHHGYLGVSAHWLDDNLERRSRVLACTHFRNPHTAERIGELLYKVHSDNKLEPAKIVSTLTDNEFSMVKAFKLFGVKLLPNEEEGQEDDDNLSDDEDELDDVPLEIEEEDARIYLPKHQRCAAHLLNLIATADYKKIVDASHFRGVHVRALLKCTQIWNGSHRQKGSEAIELIIGNQIGYPVCTRWNSLYDCINELLRYEEHLNDFLQATKTVKCDNPVFTTAELNYLKDYVALMHPIASALDYLQGDKNTYYARLMPAVFSIKTIFNQMKAQNSLIMVGNALPLVIKAFEARFSSQINLEPSAELAILAAVSHPGFKLRWADDPDTEQRAREIFVREVNKMSLLADHTHGVDTGLGTQQPAAAGGSGSFLVLRPSTTVNESFGFLNDPRDDLQLLDSYPIVKKIFKVSNTPLCSTASLERVFNFAGILNHPKRARIVPKNFETCVVLKGNEAFKRVEIERELAKKEKK